MRLCVLILCMCDGYQRSRPHTSSAQFLSPPPFSFLIARSVCLYLSRDLIFERTVKYSSSSPFGLRERTADRVNRYSDIRTGRENSTEFIPSVNRRKIEFHLKKIDVLKSPRNVNMSVNVKTTTFSLFLESV